MEFRPPTDLLERRGDRRLGWAAMLAVWALTSAVPLLALAILAAAGAIEAGPALLAAVAVAVAAAGLALLWRRDLDRLATSLRHSAADEAPRLPGLAALAREAGQLLRMRSEELVAAEVRLRAEQAILDAMPEPVFVLDRALNLCRSNEAGRHEIGREFGTILRNPDLRAAIDRLWAGEGSQTADVSLPGRLSRQLQASLISLEPTPGQDARTLLLLQDRTRERAIEQMRADFVANASHELRTPLASLIGFIDTMRGPAADDPEAQRRFLEIMAEQAARMRRLVDDLLNLYRVELVEHQRPTDSVQLAELARRVAAGWEPSVAARRAILEVDIDPALPRMPGDADQLAQVLQNLVDNALRYGPEGVSIRIAAERVEGGRWPSRPGIALTVSDTGPGIAREHLPRLTERFYRVDVARSRASGGTGLGLAIVKHIVSRHRGQLRIESTLGAGTKFLIWLPTT